MKTRIAAAIASLLFASLGTVAYAQGTHQATPQQMPPQTTPPQQMPPQTTPPQPTQPPTSTYSGQSQSNNMMPGNQVARKVKQALTAHGVTATGVTVTFNHGTATLTGTVYNQQDISKAKSAAMSVQGVKQVDTSGLHARTQGNQGQS